MAIPPPQRPVDLEHKHDDVVNKLNDPTLGDALAALRVAAEEMPPEKKEKEEKDAPQAMDGVISYNKALGIMQKIEQLRSKWQDTAMWPRRMTRDIQLFLRDISTAFADIESFNKRDFVEGVLQQTQGFLRSLDFKAARVPILSDSLLNTVLKKSEPDATVLTNDTLRKEIHRLYTVENGRGARLMKFEQLTTFDYVGLVDKWFTKASTTVVADGAPPLNARESTVSLYKKAFMFGTLVAGRTALKLSDVIYGHHIMQNNGKSILAEDDTVETDWKSRADTDIKLFDGIDRLPNGDERNERLRMALLHLFQGNLLDSVFYCTTYITKVFSGFKPDAVSWITTDNDDALSAFVGLCASNLATRIIQKPLTDDTKRKVSIANKVYFTWVDEFQQYQFYISSSKMRLGNVGRGIPRINSVDVSSA